MSGKILIAEKNPAFRGAAVHIYLEDVSRSDAESTIISEAVLKNVEHGGGVTEIPFRLQVADESVIDPKKNYSVRVWIDVDGNEQPDEKDLFSDQAYRVLTQGFGDFVEIYI